MNQLLKTLKAFPAVSEEPSATVAVLYSGAENSAWVAYEIARDFMSAPRLYAVVELFNVSVSELDSQIEYSDVEYLEDGNMNDRGWFVVEQSPWKSDDNKSASHLLLSMATQRYEFLCKDFMMQARVYHQPNAQAALLQWLSQR